MTADRDRRRSLDQALSNGTTMDAPPPLVPRRFHLTRLMSIWRSAGWPCRDAIELDLVAAGWATCVETAAGHETIRLTDAGVQLLASARQRNRRVLSAHDRLAERVATQLMAAGRLVWRELSLRARVGGDAGPSSAAASNTDDSLWLDDVENNSDKPMHLQGKGPWRLARPDVFSVRRTSVEDYLQPMVHEVKASRAGLLCRDLRLVVRGPAPTGLPTAEVVRALALPLVGELRAEPGLEVALERGEAPGQRSRSPLRMLCDGLLEELLPTDQRRAA